MTADEFPGVFSLNGQTALITGGGTGIGFGIARCLAAAGARVVLAGRRPEVVREAAERIGPPAFQLSWDITKRDTLADLVAESEKLAGPLSILVNNAGIGLNKLAVETTDEEWDELLATHLSAAFSLSREAAKGMLRRGRGSVLFIGSMGSFLGAPKVAAYSAAKAGILGAVRALAAEWSERGVRVNAICPGWIGAGIAARVMAEDPARRARILARTPAGRLGTPEDVGWAAVYLCSPAAGFITGGALIVDGGALIGF